jgi:hypothetical protein
MDGVPRRIRWLCSGAAGIVLVVAIAVALRAPLDEAQALAASFDGPSANAPGDVATGRIQDDGLIPVPLSAGGAATGATAAPSAKAAEPPQAPTGTTHELRDKLGHDLQTGNYRAAVADIDALMTTDPASADDRELRNLIVELAMRIMVGAGPEADELFDVIVRKMGTHGDDILYELVTTRGGSRAARRAEDLLKDPAVLARGSEAMRIAYELRTASCDDKPRLFDRATAEGDGRTLGPLQMMNSDCSRRSGTCCLKGDPKLKETIAAMRARLGQ